MAKRPAKKQEKPKKEKKREIVQFKTAKGKVSSKGWVVIPKEIRDEMGLKPGDEVRFTLWPPPAYMKQIRALATLHVRRIDEDPVAVSAGMFANAPGASSMMERLLEERKKEREEEERKIEASIRRHRRNSA